MGTESGICPGFHSIKNCLCFDLRHFAIISLQLFFLFLILWAAVGSTVTLQLEGFGFKSCPVHFRFLQHFRKNDGSLYMSFAVSVCVCLLVLFIFMLPCYGLMTCPVSTGDRHQLPPNPARIISTYNGQMDVFILSRQLIYYCIKLSCKGSI